MLPTNLNYNTYTRSWAEKLTTFTEKNISGNLTAENRNYLNVSFLACCRTTHEVALGTCILTSCCHFSFSYSLISLGSSHCFVDLFRTTSRPTMQRMLRLSNTIEEIEDSSQKARLKRSYQNLCLLFMLAQSSASLLGAFIPTIAVYPLPSMSEAFCWSLTVCSTDCFATHAFQSCSIISVITQETRAPLPNEP